MKSFAFNTRQLGFARKTAIAGLLAAIAAVAPVTASASLFYNSGLTAPAQGFGTAPRDLTLQATGNATVESGGLGVNPDGTIAFGSVVLDSTVHDNNGIQNVAGTASLPSPLMDDAKYGIPTIGSLGITDASQIAVLFNATEPQGDSINVTDLTLKFYTSTGGFLGAIDGSFNFASSNPGNGVAGFTFTIDAAEQPYVNTLLALGGVNTTLALEASLADFDGGPETFLIYNLGPATGGGSDGNGNSVPEPASIALLGLGLLGFAASRRKSSK